MSILDLVLKVSPALEQGKQLENINTWNNVATTTHALVVVFGFLLATAKTFNYDIGLTDDQLLQLAGTVASIGGTVISYLHHATNPNSGFKKK